MTAPAGRAAIIGGGVIGGGWAARFALNGWDVSVYDPDPQAERKIGAVLSNAARSLPALYDRPLPEPGRLTYHDTLAGAVAGADWVQESVPERLDFKRRVLAEIAAHAPEGALVGSSTSGFKPSELNAAGATAIVAHPFNPVYLLPLVELVGDAALTGRAAGLLRGIGMFPLILRKEVDAHIADRLLEAIWREALWLVKDGIASTEEIDEAIRMGFGLRWAQMGLFETYRIAGGEAGMAHFMAQFGPALQWPWSRLTDVPDFTPELVDLIAGQSDAQSGHMDLRALERLRDDNLVAMMRALKRSGSGAGGVIAAHEAGLHLPGGAGLPVTLAQQVPQDWTDANGHMNEAQYLTAGAAATDRFLEGIGVDVGYIAAGKSYFTAESHLCFLHEVRAGARLTATTQVLAGQGKALHLFHRLYTGAETLCATVETLLLHVDLGTRKSCPPEPVVAAALDARMAAQAGLDWPEAAGRFVGQREPAGARA